MKKFFLTLIVLFAFIFVTAQVPLKTSTNSFTQKDFPESSIKSPINLRLNSGYTPGKSMRNLGRIFVASGVPLTILGTILVSQASELNYTYDTRTGESGDPKGGFGILSLVAGQALSISGTIFWIVGGKKVARYRNSGNQN